MTTETSADRAGSGVETPEEKRNCGTCARLIRHLRLAETGGSDVLRECLILTACKDLHLVVDGGGGYWVRHFCCTEYVGQGEMLMPPAADAPDRRRPRGSR